MATDDLKTKIAETISAVPKESTGKELTARLEDLTREYEAANGDAARQDVIEARLTQLLRDAEAAARAGSWGAFSQFLVLFAAGAYFVGIWVYLYGLGAPRYAGVEATRSVLVFTLSVAMLGFGGLLMVRTLFSVDNIETMRERFRNAREIFLVFSGVFSTIIGFYFGTATTTAADPPNLAAPSFAAGTVSAEFDGGRAPFRGIFRRTPSSAGVAMVVRDHTLSFSAPGGVCPEGATIEVVDHDRRSDEVPVHCFDGGGGGNEMVPTNESAQSGTGPVANDAANNQAEQ